LGYKLCCSRNPDFLLDLMGDEHQQHETQIDWLLPIIQVHPTIISVLPSQVVSNLLFLYLKDSNIFFLINNHLVLFICLFICLIINYCDFRTTFFSICSSFYHFLFFSKKKKKKRINFHLKFFKLLHDPFHSFTKMNLTIKPTLMEKI